MSGRNKKQLYGAIPYRVDDDEVWVLMVTSQTRKRWIFPNGNIEKNETGAQAGAREALEEAGVKGRLDKKDTIDAIIGKSASDGIENITITFYPMDVLKEYSKWEEMDERKRKWVRLAEAKKLVKDADFRAVIEQFGRNKRVLKQLAA